MASMPLALSVHNLVSSVGADAGFAAIVGLAILVLLYFSHARETANLREQAEALSQRLADAEALLAQAQRAQPVQPSPAGAAIAVPVSPSPLRRSPAGPIPGAPAGMAAPALAAATRFIVPSASGPPTVPPVSTQQPVPAQAAASTAALTKSTRTQDEEADPRTRVGVPAATGAAAATAAASPPAASGRAPAPAGPAPSPHSPTPTPAPGAGPVPVPASAAPVSRPAPATVVGAANGASVGPARGGEDAGVLRTPERRPPAPAREPLIGPPAERRRSSGGLRFGLLVGILLVIGAVAAVIIVTSGTGSQSAAQSPSSNSPGAGGGFDPAHVTVAVLNGTATNQLAHKVAAHLAALGYQEGRIATASDQAVTATTVAYLAGAGDRNAALHVAKALNLNRSSVVPINQDAEAVACPPPGSCTANVVVTVGADLAQT